MAKKKKTRTGSAAKKSTSRPRSASRSKSGSSSKRKTGATKPKSAAFGKRTGGTRTGATRTGGTRTGATRTGGTRRVAVLGATDADSRAASGLGQGERVRLREDIQPGQRGDTGTVTAVLGGGTVSVLLDAGPLLTPVREGRLERI